MWLSVMKFWSRGHRYPWGYWGEGGESKLREGRLWELLSLCGVFSLTKVCEKLSLWFKFTEHLTFDGQTPTLETRIGWSRQVDCPFSSDYHVDGKWNAPSWITVITALHSTYSRSSITRSTLSVSYWTVQICREWNSLIGRWCGGLIHSQDHGQYIMISGATSGLSTPFQHVQQFLSHCVDTGYSNIGLGC